MQPSGFDILLEEGPCLIVCKPAGVLTQAPPYLDSIERRVKAFLKERDDKPGRVYLGVPHRLDRPVSGVLALARHVRAARRLSEQFEGRTVQKGYWTLVEGRPEPATGTWSDWMRKVPGEARAERVPQSHPEARRAVLHYRVVEERGGVSWLEVRLETGRTHQIRLQAGARGFPVLGDHLYGSTRAFGPEVASDRDRHIALHARYLGIRHPMSREPRCVVAPVPSCWPAWVRRPGSPVSGSLGSGSG